MSDFKHLYLLLIFPILIACERPDYSLLATMYSNSSETNDCQMCFVDYSGQIYTVPSGVMKCCVYPSYSAQFETYEDFLRFFFHYSSSFDIDNLTYSKRGESKLPKLPDNKDCSAMLDVVDNGVSRPKQGLSSDLIKLLVLHMFYQGKYVLYDDYSCSYIFLESVPTYSPLPLNDE